MATIRRNWFWILIHLKKRITCTLLLNETSRGRTLTLIDCLQKRPQKCYFILLPLTLKCMFLWKIFIFFYSPWKGADRANCIYHSSAHFGVDRGCHSDIGSSATKTSKLFKLTEIAVKIRKTLTILYLNAMIKTLDCDNDTNNNRLHRIKLWSLS